MLYSIVTRTLLVATFLILGSNAATQISSLAECGSCGATVCRSETYDRYAYCCDETEIGSRACGGTTAFCDSMSLNPVIDSFACPYSSGYCGASSSELIMHPTTRNNLKIEISNRLFVDAATCYYVFSVKSSTLNKNFKYFWDIEFYTRENVIVQLNNGTDLFGANDPITVSGTTGSRFQYEAEDNKIYMTFTGDVSSSSSKSPAFGYTIKLRAFDTRPPAPIIITIPAPAVDPIIINPDPVPGEPVVQIETSIRDTNIIEILPEGAGTVTPSNPTETTTPTVTLPVDNSATENDSDAIGSPNLIDESLD